jgi:dipeptidyl aminopeptidase/acylaminoacyl peptidase
MKHALWVYGLRSKEEFFELVKKINLDGVVEKIACPLLVMHGEHDQQVPLEQAQRTYEQATVADKTLKVFTREEGGAEHCQVDNRAIAADYAADWFAKRL